MQHNRKRYQQAAISSVWCSRSQQPQSIQVLIRNYM